jgi:nicotinamide-nucleotide amidase
MDQDLNTLSAEIGRRLVARGWKLATAESCTGGWVAEVVTATAGSSGWFDCGFVTYSNESKQTLLGVASATLERFGAVSEPTVREMVAGALERSRADVALAVSGVAGPGGGSADKPVGLVCFGWGRRGADVRSTTVQFAGDREAVRRQAVLHVLNDLIALEGSFPG